MVLTYENSSRERKLADATRPRASARGAGFTLVELLVAVTLLVMIVLVATYIFDTTISAVTASQGGGELNASLGAFSRVLFKDIRTVEPGGFLVLGRREQQAYGTSADRANEMPRTFRNDWMLFLTGSEQDVSSDNRVIGQCSRVFYGHGMVADNAERDFHDDSIGRPLINGVLDNYSNLCTDWVLMRHQMTIIPQIRAVVDNPAGLYGVGYADVEVIDGVWQYSTGPMFKRSALSYSVRDFRWCSWFGSWEGSVAVPYGDPGSGGCGQVAIYEPYYYHFMSQASGDARNHYALAHCGEFMVQYAMREDLTADGIRWRDPPKTSDAAYPDPNFRPGDPLHPSANVPGNLQHRYTCNVCGRTVLLGQQREPFLCPGRWYHTWKNRCTSTDSGTGQPLVYSGTESPTGRLAFGPGDRWPVLLRVTVQIYDPMDRLAGGRRASLVLRLP